MGLSILVAGVLYRTMLIMLTNSPSRSSYMSGRYPLHVNEINPVSRVSLVSGQASCRHMPTVTLLAVEL